MTKATVRNVIRTIAETSTVAHRLTQAVILGGADGRVLQEQEQEGGVG